MFEKNDRIGGLLRYGIPDFKMEKSQIDRRMEQMAAEGVSFRTGVYVGNQRPGKGIPDGATGMIAPQKLLAEFDAVVLAGGAEQPRDLPIPGRELDGVHFAMEFLPLQNKRVAGDAGVPDLWATGKHVVIIGGGDTGSDCVGTSNRHGANSVTQFELLPMPPDVERNPVWPYWPTRLRTSSSHEEGVSRDWSIATKEFVGEGGKDQGAEGGAAGVEGRQDERNARLGIHAARRSGAARDGLRFAGAIGAGLLSASESDARGNVKAHTDGIGCYATSMSKVFAAGDMRRGQSLVVWAIREGRQCARAVDEFLMGTSELPR